MPLPLRSSIINIITDPPSFCLKATAERKRLIRPIDDVDFKVQAPVPIVFLFALNQDTQTLQYMYKRRMSPWA